MLIVRLILVLAVVLVAAAHRLSSSMPGSDIQTVEGYTQLKKGRFGSTLNQINVPNSAYVSDGMPLLLDLHGPNPYSQGFDAGFLLGQEFVDNYNALMVSMLGNEWWEPAAAEIINLFLDSQWNNYLGVQVPQDFKDEISGITAGAVAAGVKADVGKIVGRGVVLANLPGSLQNFIYILMDEKANPAASEHVKNMPLERAMEIIEKLKARWNGLTCSMYGVWGSRTEKGRVFTGRNLDWLKDTGISKNKLITVHHPKDGYAHATIGWAGIWGAITGMSSQGITVHEANLESNDITFRGFPWILRLRHVMANAQNIDDALRIWKETNSTVGFNHGFGSAKDQRAVCLETMEGNSAVFGDNDPREQTLIVDNQNIGAPRAEAVYRTNHGYDPYTVSHYMWNNTGAYKDSIQRYMAFPEAFDSYQSAKKTIGYVEAVNITSIIGHKGGSGMYSCNGPYNDGSNILSVTYDPSNLIMYTAWESGSGSDLWTPAACSTYVAINMKEWFRTL